MLSACTVSGNVAGGGTLGRGGGNGGGIYNEGTLSLNACTLSSNSAGSGSFAGFGDFGSGGAGGHGGGIFNYNMLALTNCTVSANVGGAGGHGGGGYYIGSAGGAGGSGGGIYNAGTSTVIACTVSGNFGGGGGVGGNGFLSYAGGSPGGAGGSGGGIFNTATVSADSQNLLAALNSGGTGGVGGTGPSGSGSPGLSGAGPDVAGPFTSHGHNLIGQADGSIGFTNGINADLAGTTFAPLNAFLGPITNNGGPTLTMALLPGSPAIDAGDDALLSAPFYLATDQRGLPRRSGAHVDIGALELQALMLTGISKDGKDIVLSLIAEVGQTYRVEGTDSLFPAAWSIVADYLPGNGSTAQVRDTGGATHTQRFYRGRALP
jgi:hypothetical protein